MARRQLGPKASRVDDIATKSYADGGGTITLASQWRREKDRHPNIGAGNPITTHSGIVSGDLPVGSQTGMRFIAWDATNSVTSQPLFNYQGMIPAPAPSNIQTAAGRTCLLNAFTPRFFNGTSGQYYNGNQDIRVGISSTKVVPVFQIAQGQLSATSIDVHMMIEHNGAMKHLSSGDATGDGLPRVVSGGSGTYRIELTNLDHRYKEYRFLLPPNAYFLGVWIDTLSAIRRPKNKPQLWIHGVDSWQDPQTVVGNGSGWTDRDYQSLPQCTVASFHTGMCHGVDGQGGTGEYNANATSGGDADTYNGNRSSAAWSDSRVNWRANWWGAYAPIYLDIGGWNDGSSMVSPYQSTYKTRVAARVQKTIDRHAALGRDCRFVNVGIQPADVSVGDNKWLGSLGQGEIPALFPGVVLGHVPLMPMWPDTSSTGPRSIYCNNSDHIHAVAEGDDSIANYYMDRVGEFAIDQAYLNKTAQANVPVVAVPTS